MFHLSPVTVLRPQRRMYWMQEFINEKTILDLIHAGPTKPMETLHRTDWVILSCHSQVSLPQGAILAISCPPSRMVAVQVWPSPRASPPGPRTPTSHPLLLPHLLSQLTEPILPALSSPIIITSNQQEPDG